MTQHPAGAAQMRLELVFAVSCCPPLVVCRGQLIGPGPIVAAKVEDHGEQHDHLAGAVTNPVRDTVLDDPRRGGRPAARARRTRP